MADEKHASPTKVTTPKFLFTLKDMGFESTVKGFETHAEVFEWGLDSHCYSAPQVSGTFAQQEPPSSGPMYMRIPLGLHMPKLIKAMISKKAIKTGQLVMLASINNTNTPVMEIDLDNITVKEVLLGNNIHGRSNKNNRQLDNNFDNSFEIMLRFGKIEWRYIAFGQDGGKKGKDATGLNLMTGEME